MTAPDPGAGDHTWPCCGHDLVQHGPWGCEVMDCDCGQAGRDWYPHAAGDHGYCGEYTALDGIRHDRSTGRAIRGASVPKPAPRRECDHVPPDDYCPICREDNQRRP